MTDKNNILDENSKAEVTPANTEELDLILPEEPVADTEAPKTTDAPKPTEAPKATEAAEAGVIDLGRIIRTLWRRKWVFGIVLPIVAVLSIVWIFPEPRYYKAAVSMAPETGSEMDLGGISSLASSFGLNLGGDQADAIYPMLYPELFESNEFIVSLFGIQVTTNDKKLSCNYYTYMKKHQKKNELTWPVKQYFMKLKKKYFSEPEPQGNGSFASGDIDPFRLSYKDFMLVEKIKSKIKCTVDKKTNVITINVTDQDRLICATLADSLRCRLQDFITDYRTSKVRTDYEYYKELLDSAEVEYNKSVEAYAKYCDAHQDVILQAYISERDNLENDMQTKYQTALGLKTQVEAARVKVQARTPVFTTLKTATVPVKPAGPKRMLFVAAMVILATIVTSGWVLAKEKF